jgi:hypothetical protein
MALDCMNTGLLKQLRLELLWYASKAFKPRPHDFMIFVASSSCA